MDAATLKDAMRISSLIRELEHQNTLDVDCFGLTTKLDDLDAAAVYAAIRSSEDNARAERHKIREAAIFGLRAKLEAL